MMPHIIHQTWKSKEIPDRFHYFRETWLKHHPSWEYRLWTDADNREFLAINYPAVLEIYDNYATPICRADFIRVFLLKHFGGLYVDLDFECFQPFDNILNSQKVILGLEPSAHVREHAKQNQGLTCVVCNALMASPPQHPFWDHVIQEMIAARHQPGPLDATGPFLLTRAVECYRDPAALEILPAEVFYPADAHDCSEGRLFDLKRWEQTTSGAFAMHHWAGTWWRGSAESQPPPCSAVGVVLAQDGKILANSALNARQCAPFDKASPLVSCLLVTRNRFELVQCAVKGFLAQTYPARELIIVDDGGDTRLDFFLKELADSRIGYVRLRDEGAALGTLRNQAVAVARGDFICQWDDDDLYDPARLTMQMTAMLAMQADACFLNRWVIWWPKQKRLAVSTQRVWEGSMLCLKSKLGLYPTIRRGEDTPIVEKIMQSERVVLLDQPRLYVYVVHEGNTFGAEHFEAHWHSADQQFVGLAYERVMQELGKGMDFESYLIALESGEAAACSGAPYLSDHLPVGVVPSSQPGASDVIAKALLQEDVVIPPEPAHRSDWPTVLILTPIKNAAQFLPGYFELIARLDYPRGKLSLAFLEGDSNDGTYEQLQECASRYRDVFVRIDLYHHDFSFQIEGDRWAADKQFSRRSVISKCRNELFKLADRGEDRVLWIDADVVDYPPDVLLRLLDVNKPIVVPNCVQVPGGASFDLNTFKYKPGSQVLAWLHMQDGIIQPPRGVGRLYLDDLRGTGLVELDGVGGTMLLVDAVLHRQGILFPDYSYRGYLDTEGFAMHAKDLGIAAWGLPDLEIIHASK